MRWRSSRARRPGGIAKVVAERSTIAGPSIDVAGDDVAPSS